jgi:hypothetical protein
VYSSKFLASCIHKLEFKFSSISIQVPSKLKKNRMHFYSTKSVQVFWFKFLVWYTQSKNLNSRNLNGDLDAKLVSCIPGLTRRTGSNGYKNLEKFKLNGNYIYFSKIYLYLALALFLMNMNIAHLTIFN